jgi:esterase/lipase
MLDYGRRRDTQQIKMIKNFKIKNSSGDTLNIDLRYTESNKGKLPLLVFCHGFKGFKDWGCFPYMLDSISANKICCVSFNFSFNGVDNEKDNPALFDKLDLFAKNTFSRELDDLGDVIDWIESEQKNYNYDFNNLTLAGHSRGGGIAILKTAEDSRIKKMITLASVAEFNRYGEETLKRWKEEGFIEALNTRTRQKMRMNYTLIEDLEKNRERLSIVNAMKRIKVPALIIHGKEDLAVDYSDAEVLFEAGSKKFLSDSTTLKLYEKTGHTFGAVHPFAGTTKALENVIRDIVSFIKK